MGNDHPLVDSLDVCAFRFIALEQNLHAMMADKTFSTILYIQTSFYSNFKLV